MKTKILKYELFLSFLLSLATITIFYYRETLPDSYLSINSYSDSNFFSYYGVSLLAFLNYYTGPWVLASFVTFTLFYVFVFSKRDDWIDSLNFISLNLLFILFAFSFAPNFLGQGLLQIAQSFLNVYGAFFLFLIATSIFCWGVFREDFPKFIAAVFRKIMGVNFKEALNQLKLKLDRNKNRLLEFKENYLKKKEVPLLESKVEKASVAPIPQNLKTPNVNENLMTESQDESDEESQEEEGDEEIEASGEEEIEEEADDSTDEEEGESGTAEAFNEDKYYGLVSTLSQKTHIQRITNPDDRYFQDIISKIHNKLAEFKIEGRIINVLKGPVVDTFEWELGAGEKIAKLTSAADDLSLALLGAPIRMVYPMKGRGTVGIEVPRNPREIIFLDEIVSSKEFMNTTHQLPLAMGKDAFGEPVVVDLAAMPHMLVAGSTGAGKSVFINSILVSLLVKRSPLQMKLILIDPKQLELALYARLPHLIMPVITDAKTTAVALLWAVQEMERRYSIMTEFGVRNIDSFNQKLKRAPKEMIANIRKYYEYETEDTYELPYIVIIVDEFADLILTASGKEIENNICRLAAKARAAGVHLVIATQRPSVDVITGLIKANFPTRVSFRVTSSTDSRTILNANGAEKLLGKGDMLYKYGVDTSRIHSSYVDEEEIEALTHKLADLSLSFNPKVMEFLENGGEEEPDTSIILREGDSGGKDEKYDEAVRVVIEHRSASASLLQRRLGVGYNRAANLIEEMEANGVVGPAQGSKPRKVLLGSDIE